MKKQYKPFNLAEALQGNVKVETKAGQEVTELTYLKTRIGPYKVIGIICGHLYTYTENGIFDIDGSYPTHDLQMYNEVQVCYCNVYKMPNGKLYVGPANKTKEDAINNACPPNGYTYIKTIEVTDDEDMCGEEKIEKVTKEFANKLGIDLDDFTSTLACFEQIFGGDIKLK